MSASEVSFSILRYAVQKLHDGDMNAVLDLGFEVDELRAMEGLTLRDLQYLSRVTVPFLRVQVDHDVYRAMLTRVRDEAQTEAMQDTLILQGAPRQLMQTLYGMTPQQYSNRRRLLRLTGQNTGRPPRIPEELEHTIWRHWSALQDAEPARRYLETAQRSQTSVANVWQIVKPDSVEG
ncbi:hypothetical protein B1C78_00625 [Thioalkalivibrio denitrificans]|uniref:DUF2857 domain-containing protein n=1 Tax=Thioalkalivibrio denitrificans TaxID=108003 RepID=A0A1V3NV12_9GAMM|nr:DUF2857 domain-containing protein [Thioalkalivibrio denitrificans]OOG28871.1 hypothetical protein B1C78_00625 [Thioalkalivibrio denitrificans]